MGIPENIDSLLVKFDITQETLARIAQVAPSTVNGWRNGSVPRKSAIDNICEALELSYDDIMSDEYGLAAKEHGRLSAPPYAIPVKASAGTAVPLRVIGTTHAGERMDNDERDYTFMVPEDIATRHPRAFGYKVEGDCMNRRYPDGCHILVDPDVEPKNGSAVVAEFEDGRSVLRSYLRGSNTLMLTADSFSDKYDDIVVTQDDPPVMTRGTVVWFQASSEMD